MQEWERNIDGHIGPEALFWRRPIGWFWIGLALLNATVLFVAMTPPGHYIWPGVIASVAWFALLIFWVFRFVAYLGTNSALGRPHAFRLLVMLRQLAIPVIFIVSLSLLLMEAPLHLAFRASLPELERVVQGPDEPEWAGAYRIKQVDRQPTETWITIEHAGWVNSGFVYVSDGQRPAFERSGEMRDMADGWYIFMRN
ncbi:MAG: hypothetical protein ACFCVE_03255 [Phycisphaerae bacterium]